MQTRSAQTLIGVVPLLNGYDLEHIQVGEDGNER